MRQGLVLLLLVACGGGHSARSPDNENKLDLVVIRDHGLEESYGHDNARKAEDQWETTAEELAGHEVSDAGQEEVLLCQMPCPEDDDPCTEAVCASGCEQVPLTGPTCDDHNACTDGDTCVGGHCVGQRISCNDNDPCTDDACDPTAGCLHATAPDGAQCDDHDACTENDWCIAGSCTGTDVSCDDLNPCTKDTCLATTGCIHSPLTGPPCDDGTVCTGDDHCEHGMCSGTLLHCDDGNPCTAHECDPILGCLNLPADGAPCDDGDACTDIDRCVAGICEGQATTCDDGNPCTLDKCSTSSGCIHTMPSGLPCDDGDACTVSDLCFKGVCTPGHPADCDDHNTCTADGCDPVIGCTHAATPGTPCDDGNACTILDTCQGPSCTGTWLDCDDSNDCTADICDTKTGCTHVPKPGPCDDHDPCTSGDFCEGGACHPGADPDCLEVRRVVLAGDSWSAGLILPMREAFDQRGYEEVTISWELTSKPGSKVEDWLTDPNLLVGLFLSLDADPPADILFFTLGGNDYLRACTAGLGLSSALEWWLTMDTIQTDLVTFMALAQSGRPHLKVVLIGYDYLHYDMIMATGFNFPGMNLFKFNLGMVDLAHRQRAAVAAGPNRLFAHNMGLLQHVFGDHAHPPFLCPGLPSCPEYPPGAAPRPGPAPTYDPFPGGWWTYPSPLDRIPDGIHPDAAGFRAIIENTLDQGVAAWIEGK